MKQKILHLNLTFKWFDLIKSGEKTSEYRRICEYWNKRLVKEYDIVQFRRGYTKETMQFGIKSIGKTTEKNDLNLKECWEIKLLTNKGVK